MNLPKLQPVPIKTKNRALLIRLWLWVTSVRQWIVIEDWTWTLPDGTQIIIPKGFKFDGASIPKPLWALLSPTGLLLVPGLIHDFAYRYDYLWARDQNEGLYKYGENRGQKYWDGVFRDVGIQVNGLTIIDTLAWLTLYAFGRFAWRGNRKLNEPELQPVGFDALAPT